MGQQQSQQIQQQQQQLENNPYNKSGYHVLQVHQNSPSSGKLVPFFDFIVAANQVVFEKEDTRFSDTFKSNIGKPVTLIVYNIKSDSTREVPVIPSTTWGGQGLAGISIRYCSWEKTLENVWHVLDVYLNSPAHDAQLQSRIDYIVGTPDLILNEQEDFFTLINNNMYRPIQLYVYSSLTEQIRLVTITPNKNWGGSGSLGCDIGFGLLHRIPTKQQLASPMVNPGTPNLLHQHQQQQEKIAHQNIQQQILSSSPQNKQPLLPQQPLPISQPLPTPQRVESLKPPQDQFTDININNHQQEQQFLTPQKDDDTLITTNNKLHQQNNEPIKFNMEELQAESIDNSNIDLTNQFSKVQL
ncbi:hypothetical protein DICPUDRAFT_156632 [Dictyostelium purpureum]|uniref:PDZ GRASP-type domain-containing protein n=1 Tax=Dictyostelium purpureum TaxID=5786 RepID=F0ZX17_DICPU|nr:uncharacterized protein DICPUDRAFT_156632 [Dictyostelium purpureum]EGC31515.1 hypothetical protein DICPUDRAFT_156632 [Dictyostelium purpureum]|eukprot:XP_003291967.1 hypothetical protein DICPUDRAFT_156632 [Dictyostelium purpureum]